MVLHSQAPLPQRLAFVYDVFAPVAAPSVANLVRICIDVLYRIGGGRCPLDQHRTSSLLPDLHDVPDAFDRDVFVDWASTDLALGLYLHRHTRFVDVRVGRVDARLAVLDVLDRYDRAASRLDRTVSLDHALYLMGWLTGPHRLTADEIGLVTGVLGQHGRVDRAAFETMAQAVIMFEVACKHSGKGLGRTQAEALIRMQHRFDPTDHRVRAELESLDYDGDDPHAAAAWVLTRPRWLQSKCPESLFETDLYLEFEKYDADQSGKLSAVEVSDMIYSNMVRDYIGDRVMQAAHHSQDLMKSMVQALALEIVQNADQDDDLHITWPELRLRAAYIKQRCKELAQWFLDYHLSFLARYFAFDADRNATLDVGEIEAALLQRLRPLVVERILSPAESAQLAHDTTQEIISATDQDGNGIISVDEFNSCLHRIAALEAQMLHKALQVRTTRASTARSYAKALPKSKLATLALLRPARS